MARLGTPLVILAALFTVASACSSPTPLEGEQAANQESSMAGSGTEMSDETAESETNDGAVPNKEGQPETLRFDDDANANDGTDTDRDPGDTGSTGTGGGFVIFDDPASWPRSIGFARTPVPDGTWPDYQDLFLPDRSFVATVIGDGVEAWPQPNADQAEHWFSNPTQFGGDRVFLVIDQSTSSDFIKISLPIKPNGQEGWIARDQVIISEVRHRAVVDLTNHALTVWSGDEILVQTKVVTGKPATPTPVGRFFVRDIITRGNPGGAYGPYIVALSGFSEALETFAGGLPAIAIHGTNNPGLIGQERSNGCIRIPNDLVSKLAKTVPLGTPVTVVA